MNEEINSPADVQYNKPIERKSATMSKIESSLTKFKYSDG